MAVFLIQIYAKAVWFGILIITQVEQSEFLSFQFKVQRIALHYLWWNFPEESISGVAAPSSRPANICSSIC